METIISFYPINFINSIITGLRPGSILLVRLLDVVWVSVYVWWTYNTSEVEQYFCAVTCDIL